MQSHLGTLISREPLKFPSMIHCSCSASSATRPRHSSFGVSTHPGFQYSWSKWIRGSLVFSASWQERVDFPLPPLPMIKIRWYFRGSALADILNNPCTFSGSREGVFCISQGNGCTNNMGSRYAEFIQDLTHFRHIAGIL